MNATHPARTGLSCMWWILLAGSRIGVAHRSVLAPVDEHCRITDHRLHRRQRGIDGPIEPGPTLYEWAQSLALLGDPSHSGLRAIEEARTLRPNSYPTRALYGHYLSDSFARVVGWAPEHVTVRVHRSRAVALADTRGDIEGPQGVRLENGTRLHDLKAVVLAVGHVPAGLAPARHGLPRWPVSTD